MKLPAAKSLTPAANSLFLLVGADQVNPIPVARRAEGFTFGDTDGKRYMDFPRG